MGAILFGLFFALGIKGGIVGVEVLGVQIVLGDAEGIAKPLVMHDLPLAEELDGIPHVRVVAEAEDIVVGHAGLLLSRQILMQVGDDVSLDPHVLHVEGHAGGGDGIQSRGMIHKVGGEGTVLDLLLREVAGELVQDGSNHFQMGKFFGANVRKDPHHLLIRHGVTLMQVAHRGGELTVGPAELGYDDLSQLGVGVLDLDGILQFLLIDPHNGTSSVCVIFPGEGLAHPVPGGVALVAESGHRGAGCLILGVESLALCLELIVRFQRVAGMRVHIQIQDGFVECKIHRADLIHETLAGSGVGAISATASAFSYGIHGRNCVIVIVIMIVVMILRSVHAATATAPAGDMAVPTGAYAVVLCGAEGTVRHTAGHITPIAGTAVGGAIVVKATAAAAETVILIHHDRLLSARSKRQAHPSAVKLPSPPKGRSSSVNRVPRFKAVAGS